MIFGNLGNMGEMLKQAKKMQEDLKTAKKELSNEVFEDERGGVRAKVTGDMEIKSITIDPKLAVPDKISQLEERTKDAINGALKKSKDFAAQKLRKLTGGMNIPGLT